MTALCVLNLIDKYAGCGRYASLSSFIKINRPVSRIQGTSAELIEGDSLSVHDLMYGMMLPSGNDAAVALATHFGGVIKGAGKADPEIVVTPSAVERRLRAFKIVSARNYKEQLEQNTYDQDEDFKSEENGGSAGMGGKMVDNSESMTCKQLFNHFNQSYKTAASYVDISDKRLNH